MKVALFGATGYIGGSVLTNLLQKGHTVQALARDPGKLKTAGPGVTIVQGNLGDADAIKKTVSGCEAVIWAVGATKNPADQVAVYTAGIQAVLAAMRANKVRRLLVLSGAAMIIPGEGAALQRRIMQLMLKIFLARILETNKQVFAILEQNRDIDWTVIRPAWIPQGKPSGALKHSATGMVGTRIDLADLGQFFVEQLSDRTYLQKAPFLASA